MPKLDLTRAKQIKGPMGEILALKGVGFEWVRPPHLPDFYGIAPGQAPLDLRLDDPAVAGGYIQTVRNDGGAGAAFALSSTGTVIPYTAGSVTFTASTQHMTFASAIDMAGVHVVMPVRVISTEVAANRYPRVLSGNGTGLFLDIRAGRIGFTAPSGHPLNGVSVNVGVPEGPWILWEIRYSGGLVVFYRDGVEVGRASAASQPFLVNRINGESSYWLRGSVGRAVSVITDPARSPDNLEPAALVARQTLAAQYGIALP